MFIVQMFVDSFEDVLASICICFPCDLQGMKHLLILDITLDLALEIMS